jgi:hypothetical protein
MHARFFFSSRMGVFVQAIPHAVKKLDNGKLQVTYVDASGKHINVPIVVGFHPFVYFFCVCFFP